MAVYRLTGAVESLGRAAHDVCGVPGHIGDAQGESVLNAKSVGHLKDLLAKDASDLVTATIQKLQEAA
jgi:hypothetical protein